MTDIRVVTFDIDDTLYLERDYVASGFRAVADELLLRFGIANAAELLWRSFLAGNRGTIFDDLLNQLGIAPTHGLIAELVDIYREHEPDIRLLPDAQACLAAIRGSADIAVITDGPVASQRAKAHSLGLSDIASFIVYTGDLGPGMAKPSPLAFELVERHFGVQGAACSYVADNPTKDFKAPLERGWTCVRVRRDGGLHHGVHFEGELLEVEDMTTLPDWLK